MSSSNLFALAALITGALVPFQLAFNAQLGAVTKNPFTAGLIVFIIGTILLAAAALAMRLPAPSATELIKAPPTIWLGGVITTSFS